MERRSFIKQTCRVCLLGAGGLMLADTISSCSPAVANKLSSPAVINNQVQIPLSLFEKQHIVIVSPAKYPYEIAVEKSGGTYKALLLRCTHYDNQLTPTGSGYTCSLHGSTFDVEGAVVKGPAEKHLKELQVILSNANLLIHL